MTFYVQISYNRLFQQVIHKGGESAINYIKRFHNTKALEISLQDSYYEDKLIHTLLDNIQKRGKESTQISSNQAESRRVFFQ